MDQVQKQMDQVQKKLEELPNNLLLNQKDEPRDDQESIQDQINGLQN